MKVLSLNLQRNIQLQGRSTNLQGRRFLPFQSTLVDDETFLWTTDGQDARLRWVDDRAEVGHIEHAQVGHGEGAALELLWLQFPISGFGGECFDVL